MKGFCFLVFIALLCSLKTTAQKTTEPYKAIWLTKPSVGRTIPITKLLKGNLSDNLFDYDDRAVYWQLLSLYYFPKKHWGVSFQFQAMSSAALANNNETFNAALEKEFGSQYYLTHSGNEPENVHPIGGKFGRGFIGVNYRIEKNRLLLQPQIGFGVGSYFVNWKQVLLKEKNTNTLLRIQYEPKDKVKDNILLNASMAVGYKLSRRFYLNLDLMGSYFRTQNVITKTTTNMVTEVAQSEQVNYKGNIFSFNFGLGIFVVL